MTKLKFHLHNQSSSSSSLVSLTYKKRLFNYNICNVYSLIIITTHTNETNFKRVYDHRNNCNQSN